MQGQLGLDKKNPVITIESTGDDNHLIVYIGFKYYTCIPNSSKSVRYRLLVAELAMAEFSIVSLMKIFGFSRPTIMKYREIVANTIDETEMFDKLRGYNSKKTKLLPEVEDYIIKRFPKIYTNNRATYNQQLREEIYKKYNITLSPEALRAVIAPLRKALDDGKLENSTQPQSVGDDEIVDSQIDDITDEILLEEAIIPNTIPVETTFEDGSDQHIAENGPTKVYPNLYAGLLVLNFWIADFIVGVENLSKTYLQWIYQILFAAVNFEQARYLSRELLGELMGETAISVSKSRSILKNLAENRFCHTFKSLFQSNLECIQKYWENTPHYFYIDGHFDPYYGQTEILKGWCCLLNRTMKGTNHYVIHDMNGCPVVKDLKDCFGDFRDYLKEAIGKINRIVSARPFGIVFDRGGFSQDLFAEFHSQGKYFITWEKNFDINNEPKLNFDSEVVIEREINEVGNFKLIYFRCAETTFQARKGFSCRKIILCTQQEGTNGEKSDFYASILTNDPAIDHQLLVELMTNRWQCQENDFKYEKKHFGLDQITSYSITPRMSIQELIDKQKGNLKVLIQQQTEDQAKKNALYAQLGVKRLTQKRVQTIEKQAAENPKMYESMVALRTLQPELQALTLQIDQLKKKLKRLKKIEKNGYVRLDYRKKQILDQIRFSSRNIFYLAVNEFKSYYPNLRDYHEVFRKLTHASGHIEFSKEHVIVDLYCPFFTDRVLRAVTEFVKNLNQKQPTMLDGTNRKITFFVNSKVAN